MTESWRDDERNASSIAPHSCSADEPQSFQSGWTDLIIMLHGATSVNGLQVSREKTDAVVVIRADQTWLRLDWVELWAHRDLAKMLIRRDLLARYRQTILGPIWFLIQPLIMAAIFSLVFAEAARMPTHGVSPLLFYLSSLLGWNLFSQSVSAIGGTFTANANLFSKVYFPRLIVPCAVLVSNLVTMGLQFVMFLGFLVYYVWFTSHPVPPVTWHWLLLPLLVTQTAMFSFGAGLLIAAFTGRYRDLLHALPFLITGWMFLSPVFIPLSEFTDDLILVSYLNPMAPIVEGFREILLGVGSVSPSMFAASIAETLVVVVFGTAMFQRVARTVVDTV